MTDAITGKALTYVELDLDVYRVSTFEGARVGENVLGWTRRFGTNTTMTGVTDDGMPSGRAARLQLNGGNRVLFSMDALPVLTNVSCLGLFRAVGTVVNNRMGFMVRGTGGDGTDNGYFCRFIDGGQITLGKRTAGVSSFPMTFDFTYEADEYLWMRFDAIDVDGGVLLRMKAWRGELSDEPDLFTTSVEDLISPHTAAGWAGLYADANGPHNCGVARFRSYLGSETETLRFAQPTDYLPDDIDAIPDMVSVATSPGQVALGQSLGKRATVTAGFKDHRHADLGELFASGSWWGRFRARQLARRGLPLRVRRGLLGQDLDDFETRHYILESFDGPSPDGVFRLNGQDQLKQLSNDRAQCPVISNGFLAAAIDNNDTTFNALPSGIGNAEYPSSGYIAVGGQEIMSFTRVGDAFTVVRGLFGTDAAALDAEDRIQLCEYIEAESPADILYRLFTVFAGMDPDLIPLANWQLECDTFLGRLYTRLIAEPTGVDKLASELIEQAGLVVWPDDLLNQVRLQVLRGIATTAFEYTPDNVIADTIKVQDQPNSLITQVWTYYGVRNPLRSLEDRDNYRSTLASINAEEETLNGSAVIKKIFGTWIQTFARTNAERVNDLQLGRFSKPPRLVGFDVLRYSDVMEPQVGGGYRLAYYGAQDEIGGAVNIPIQVTRVEPLADRWRVTAEEMRFEQFDPADLQNRVIPIDANVNNINLRELHDSIYPELTEADIGSLGVTVRFIINTGVIVGSTSVSEPSVDVGDWLDGFVPELEVNGRIQGKGGNGGHVGETEDEPDASPEDGGTALFSRHPINVTYGSEAEVWGGGGGGAVVVFFLFFICGGGGGAGQLPGEAGNTPDAQFEDENELESEAEPGTTEAGGNGPVINSDGSLFSVNNDGGGPGLAGSSGSGIAIDPPGAAGNAVDGISFINVLSGTADVRGPTIN